MKKYYIIDMMIPQEGMYATTLKGDLCTTSIARLATRFNSIKEAKEYQKQLIKTTKIRTLKILDIQL